MRKPRIKMGTAMLAVVVIAVDLGLIRHAFSSPPEGMTVAAVGVLLTSNILAWAVYRLVTSRDSRRPFRLGFVAHGLIAVLASLAYAWRAPVAFMDAAMPVLDPVLRALEAAVPRSVQDSAWFSYASGATIVTVVLGLPLLAYAALGGSLCWLVARVSVPPRRSDGSEAASP